MLQMQEVLHRRRRQRLALAEAVPAQLAHLGQPAPAAVDLVELLAEQLAQHVLAAAAHVEHRALLRAQAQHRQAAPAPHRALLPAGSHGLRDTLWVAPARTMSSPLVPMMMLYDDPSAAAST